MTPRHAKVLRNKRLNLFKLGQLADGRICLVVQSAYRIYFGTPTMETIQFESDFDLEVSTPNVLTFVKDTKTVSAGEKFSVTITADYGGFCNVTFEDGRTAYGVANSMFTKLTPR